MLNRMGSDGGEKMITKDKGRKWMWCFLAGAVGLQVYFVQEILAAFALFAFGFMAIALLIGSFYMLHGGWVVAVERLAESRHPVIAATRQGIDAVGDLARRPFRRPGSEAAQ